MVSWLGGPRFTPLSNTWLYAGCYYLFANECCVFNYVLHGVLTFLELRVVLIWGWIGVRLGKYGNCLRRNQTQNMTLPDLRESDILWRSPPPLILILAHLFLIIALYCIQYIYSVWLEMVGWALHNGQSSLWRFGLKGTSGGRLKRAEVGWVGGEGGMDLEPFLTPNPNLHSRYTQIRSNVQLLPEWLLQDSQLWSGTL